MTAVEAQPLASSSTTMADCLAVPPLPSELLSNGQPEEAQPGEVSEVVPGELAALVVVGRTRRDLLVHEVADGVAQQQLLFRQHMVRHVSSPQDKDWADSEVRNVDFKARALQ